MTAKEKMTAPIASVGADVEQPSSNKLTNQSIADLPGKGNLPKPQIMRKIQQNQQIKRIQMIWKQFL